MCTSWSGPLDVYHELGMEVLQLPTPDYSAPLLEDIKKALAFIERMAAEDKTVYVHCKAGR